LHAPIDEETEWEDSLGIGSKVARGDERKVGVRRDGFLDTLESVLRSSC